MNTMNIFSISEDLQSLVQSDMKNRVYQIQRMLANKLDSCKERENKYVDNNIKKIQELYKDEEQQREEKGKGVQDEEVLLYRLYKESTRFKTTKLSFIQDEINNLEKYMKFVYSSTKTKLFNLLPYYKSIQAKGE